MIKFDDPCSESKGQLENHETGSAREIQDGRRRHLAFTFSAAISLLFIRFGPDFAHNAFNAAAHFKNLKPEVEAEIQDGVGGHLGFFKMRLISQLLTDFDKTW